MPSRESYEVNKEEKSLVQKAKREANQEEILAAALGMRMGPQKPPAAFWQPLKLFAYSQLTSLVRRATLKEGERAAKSDKVHNFKVRLPYCCIARGRLHNTSPRGDGGGETGLFWSSQ